ncbi:unnamed protein product [Camellia sinensis]
MSQTNFPLFRHDQASPRSPPSLATGERDRRTSPPPPTKHQRHLITDIRELISLDDVMEELRLGPNGGLLYCMEYPLHLGFNVFVNHFLLSS